MNELRDENKNENTASYLLGDFNINLMNVSIHQETAVIFMAFSHMD